jgi:hypothetical protein
MRYKRVSHFNKRDSQEAFIIDKMHQGVSTESIMKGLVDNYTDISNIDEDDNTVSTEELIDNFQDRIYNIKKKCNDKIGELSKNIDNIRDNMKTIDELLADLKKSSESTNININYFLNKLNTLILNQEENIK